MTNHVIETPEGTSEQTKGEAKKLIKGRLFIDGDGDICIDDGREFNLIACPALTGFDPWEVLNPDVVQEIVRRWNEFHAHTCLVTNGAEDRWVEDTENSCPHCGGSGHKDDATKAPSMPSIPEGV